jgi:putative peptidoglycan lipid II flippase
MSNKKIIRRSIIVMALIITGKILGLVRDSLIAAKFGATYVTDIYSFALGIVYLLTTISYGLTTTFIPMHTEHLQKSSKEVRDRFVNKVISVSAVFTIILTIILIVFSKYIIFIFGHGFGNDPKVFASSVRITRIMLISLIFVSIQSVVTGVLQAHKEFYEPAAMSMVSNIIYVMYLIFLASKFGIVGFAAATVMGFFMQFLINVPKYKKLGYSYNLVFDFKDKEVNYMFKLMIPVIISTSVVQLNAFVNRSFATNIFFGAVTILEFANKVNTLAYEVFAIGISMIIYPTLSELAVKGNKEEYKKALGRGISTIMIIMIPAAVAIGLLRQPLITIIFKRGAFGNNAANLTSNALFFYCPAMVAYGVRDILNKAFYAIKDTKTPMINSFIGIFINIVINIFIVKYMQVSGLTLATTVSSIVTTLLMFWNLNKKLNGMEIKKIFISFMKIVMSSTLMGIIIFIINKLTLTKVGSGMKGSITSILACFIFGSLAYFICLHITKIEEYKLLTQSFKSKFSNHI